MIQTDRSTPEFTTLAELVEELAADVSGRIRLRLHRSGEVIELTSTELHHAAMCVAVHLEELGVRPKSHAVLIAEPTIEFVAGLLGCAWSGIIAVPLPPPGGSVGQAGRRSRLEAVANVVGPQVVIGQGATGLLIPGAIAVHAVPQATRRQIRKLCRLEVLADDVAIVQFTSGSTADPKGCVLTHGAVAANLAYLQRSYRVDGRDVGLGWLPLYHDMGLIGQLLLPLSVSGMSVDIHPPESFVANPLSWLRHLHELSATISPIPSSVLGLMAPLLRSKRARFDMTSLRNLIVGAEPIDAGSAEAFMAGAFEAGFDPIALKPSYGMAEATLLVSMADGVQLVKADRPGTTDTRATMVSLGEVSSKSVRTSPVEESLEQIFVKSSSLMLGYLTVEGLDRSSFTSDGWLATGDVGSIHEGLLTVTGRLSDVICIGGRKIHPIDIEHRIRSYLRPERVSFAVIGAPRVHSAFDGLVVVVERHRRLADLLTTIDQAVRDETGLVTQAICIVEKLGIPRTTSGKVRRTELRSAYTCGDLHPVSW